MTNEEQIKFRDKVIEDFIYIVSLEFQHKAADMMLESLEKMIKSAAVKDGFVDAVTINGKAGGYIDAVDDLFDIAERHYGITKTEIVNHIDKGLDDEEELK